MSLFFVFTLFVYFKVTCTNHNYVENMTHDIDSMIRCNCSHKNLIMSGVLYRTNTLSSTNNSRLKSVRISRNVDRGVDHCKTIIHLSPSHVHYQYQSVSVRIAMWTAAPLCEIRLDVSAPSREWRARLLLFFPGPMALVAEEIVLITRTTPYIGVT